MKISLFTKFAVIMIFLSIGPLIFVGIRTVNINKEALQITILEFHTQIAKSIADKVYKQMEEVDNEIPFITRTLSIEELPWSHRETILQTILDSHLNIVSISLLDLSGKEKFKVYNPTFEKQPKLLNFNKDKNLLEIKSGEKRSIGPVFLKNENVPCMNLFYNLNLSYFLSITVSLEEVLKEITNIRLGKTGYVYVVDKNKTIILHTFRKNLLKKSPDTIIFDIALNSGSFGSSEYRDENSKEVVSAYASVKGFNWAVITQQLKDEAYYSSKIIQNQAIYLIIASILLASLVSFLIARNLVRPILELIKAAFKISQRDFSVKVKTKTNDELNDLIKIFNSMTSELKKYEDIQIDKLIAEKTKTEAVIFSIGDGIIMTDNKGEILLVNSQAKKMLQITESNLEGKLLWNYISDKQLQVVLNEMILNTGQQTKIKEIDFSSPDLAKFYQTKTQPVVTLKGEDLGLVTVIRDITLEKEIDRMKDDFLHSITHDLRNPITSIKGFLGFMLDDVGGKLNEQQRKMAETMERASNRLLNMVNDILDIAKLESGKIELQIVKSDLIQIIQRVIELIEPQRIKKNISINFDKPDTKLEIKMDTKLIERVINNLVGNAIKFTNENGSIIIDLIEKNNSVEFSIFNTGEGIPEEYITKIFDKFQQVTGQRRGGTGLGLTICKYIIESHNGKIWVESELNKGAKFIFTLPKE